MRFLIHFGMIKVKTFNKGHSWCRHLKNGLVMYFKGIDLLTTLVSFNMWTATNKSISPNMHAMVWKIFNIHQETRKSTECLNIIAPETPGNCNLFTYRQTSNISRTLVGNKLVDHSACRRCSSYIFFLDLTPGLNWLGKGNCKTIRESFKFLDKVRLVLDVLRYIFLMLHMGMFQYHMRRFIVRSHNVSKVGDRGV